VETSAAQQTNAVMPSRCQRSLLSERISLTNFANAPANSAEDYCSAVAAAVAVVANQVVAAAWAVSSTAVHSGSAAGRIAELQPPVLRYSPAVAGEIPEA